MNTLALVSMVAAVYCWSSGVATALAARREIRHRGERGGGLVMTSPIVTVDAGALAVLLAAGVFRGPRQVNRSIGLASPVVCGSSVPVGSGVVREQFKLPSRVSIVHRSVGGGRRFSQVTVGGCSSSRTILVPGP